MGPCIPTSGTTCGGPAAGGGGSPPGEGGIASDSGAEEGEGGLCPAAAEIFNMGASTCASCVAANCCSATSCPNDQACVAIATCVAQSCLLNDGTCLTTCEGASPTGTVTEYIDFQQCVGQSCVGCPLVNAGDI